MNFKYNKQIKNCYFGLERECLRVKLSAELALTKHPEYFGDKLTKKFITTDFSESQVEMITPVFDDIDKLYDFANNVYDVVCSNIDEDELLWCQSMPCIIKGQIPVAKYEGEKGKASTKYREMLIKKYGGEKQLICGIHFNFSFKESALKELYEMNESKSSFEEFKNQVYLKVARNYLKYSFIIVYLLGCSNVCHKSFYKECIDNLERKDEDSFYLKEGTSIRNSRYGYKNNFDLYPDYSSLDGYIESINGFVKKGYIDFPKEFYSQIRLKSKKGVFEELKNTGIEYVEIRTIDINPFNKIGLDKKDVEFLHLFLMYMLIKEETGNCLKEAKENSELVAEYGYKKQITIDGQKRDTKQFMLKILDEISQMCHELEMKKDDIISFEKEKVLDHKKAYFYRQNDMEFIKDSLKLSKEYKVMAKKGFEKMDKNRLLYILS